MDEGFVGKLRVSVYQVDELPADTEFNIQYIVDSNLCQSNDDLEKKVGLVLFCLI
jgi:hypothetical protein